MGPSPFSDGRAAWCELTVEGVMASMGPSPFSDGRIPISPTPTASSLGFNGAIAFQRWKVVAATDADESE